MKIARSVLGTNGVSFSESVFAQQSKVDDRLCWVLDSGAHMEVWPGDRSIEGRWYIKVGITYDTDPLDEKGMVFIRKGSLGLWWEPDPEQDPLSFVRYDVDIRDLGSLTDSCHLNVFQPLPFDDRIHFRLPSVMIAEWQLGPTLEFLCSTTLRDEIAARFR